MVVTADLITDNVMSSNFLNTLSLTEVVMMQTAEEGWTSRDAAYSITVTQQLVLQGFRATEDN